MSGSGQSQLLANVRFGPAVAVAEPPSAFEMHRSTALVGHVSFRRPAGKINQTQYLFRIEDAERA